MASSDPETKMDVDEHVVASYPGGDDDGSPVQETTLAETKEAKQEESNETMGAGKATKSDEQVASNSVDDDSPKKEITSAEESEKKMEAETDTKVDVELQGPSSSGGASAEKEITPTDESAKNIETEKAANTKADLKEQVARSSGDASAEKEIPPESAKKIETETFTDAKVDVEEQVSRSSSDDSPTKVMASLEDSEKEVRAETAELEKKMDTEKVTDTKMDIDEEDSSRSGGNSPTEETTPIKESKKKIEAKNSTATKDQTTTGADNPLCLHDCLSLGEIELGLIQSNRAVEEIQRLPLFLRVLSLTRPLASISILETDEDGNHGDGDGDSKKNDPLVNRVVERLEHVAATYSVAEGVDVLTCHLAPSVSRKISKLPPLQMKGSDWDTTALATVARNPRSNKRKRSKSVSNGDQAGPEQDDGIGGSWEEDDDEDGEEDAVADEDAAEHQSLPNTPAAKKQKALNRRDSMEVAAQDSLEATVSTN